MLTSATGPDDASNYSSIGYIRATADVDINVTVLKLISYIDPKFHNYSIGIGVVGYFFSGGDDALFDNCAQLRSRPAR